jgi:hypothetical protein
VNLNRDFFAAFFGALVTRADFTIVAHVDHDLLGASIFAVVTFVALGVLATGLGALLAAVLAIMLAALRALLAVLLVAMLTVFAMFVVLSIFAMFAVFTMATL